MIQRLVIKDGGKVWRCIPQSITVRGGLMIARERRDYAARHEAGTLDDELLLTLPNLSLLRHGTSGIEVADLSDEEVIPDVGWTAIDLSNEQDWLDIPENVLVTIIDAVFKANPHRSLEYDFLSTALKQVRQLMTNSSSLPDLTLSANGSAAVSESA